MRVHQFQVIVWNQSWKRQNLIFDHFDACDTRSTWLYHKFGILCDTFNWLVNFWQQPRRECICMRAATWTFNCMYLCMHARTATRIKIIESWKIFWKRRKYLNRKPLKGLCNQNSHVRCIKFYDFPNDSIMNMLMCMYATLYYAFKNLQM